MQLLSNLSEKGSHVILIENDEIENMKQKDTDNPIKEEKDKRKSSFRRSIADISKLNPFKDKNINKNETDIPCLEWINLYKDGHNTASVLISAQLIEIQFATNLYPTMDSIAGLPKEISMDMMNVR